LSLGGLLPVAFAVTRKLSGRLGRSLPFFVISGSVSGTKAPHAEPVSAGPVSAFFLTVSAVSAAGAVQPVRPAWLTHSATLMVHWPLPHPSVSQAGSPSVQSSLFGFVAAVVPSVFRVT